MIVFRRDQKRREAEAADHQILADDHLPLDAFSDLLYGNTGPIQVLSFAEERSARRCLLFVLGNCRHGYFPRAASRPDPPAAYSGCTFTTPYWRSSPSRIAAIIHKKLICPPGAATLG